MKAQAKHGKVLLTDHRLLLGQLVEEGQALSREEAVDLMLEIASAVHLSGDISDPRGVNLHEAVRLAAFEFHGRPTDGSTTYPIDDPD